MLVATPMMFSSYTERSLDTHANEKFNLLPMDKDGEHHPAVAKRSTCSSIARAQQRTRITISRIGATNEI